MSGFSDEYKLKILDRALGEGVLAELKEGFLALTTVAVLGSDKGTTITEATYTGYARKKMKASDWNAAVGNEKTNLTEMIFPECTALESSLLGWALCTTAETKSGLVVCSGVVPVTVIVPGISPKFKPGALAFKLTDS